MVISTSNTFKWPDKEDKIWYANDSIVEKINAPVSINNRSSYKVPEMAKYLFGSDSFFNFADFNFESLREFNYET
ncbi:unnamed protein product [Chilo suppressalis]|uniref:Uncharacterized protein n=1 Tax=Chilo suppressalis TaxID=168631 RepID=A0ABN8B7A9_CHISP|nr:unnamed protein product [Chilo suppressalis]